MRVKVIRATRHGYWYSNKIGEMFEVNDKPIITSYGILRYKLKKDSRFLLDAEDVEKMEFIFR